MLHRALVGLDAEEAQAGRGGDRLGDLDHGRGRGHAAAAGAAVDLDEDVERGAVLLRRRREVGDVRHVVDADDDAAAVLRQAGEAVDLGRVADLVRDQDVLDAGAGEDLGLGDLLAADADGAALLHLQLQHVDRLVHLAVGAVAHVVGAGVVAHLLDVALERVEVEDQAGGLDVLVGHADGGGDVVADLELVDVLVLGHGLPLHLSQGSLSRSTLPPVMMTPTRLPAKVSRFFRMVASGTAELGSITIFMRAQIRRMASTISCSEAVSTSVT